MENRWLQHLSKFRRANYQMDAKDVMREARKSYSGGGVPTPYVQSNSASNAASVTGGRRKSRRQSSRSRSRRTRRR